MAIMHRNLALLQWRQYPQLRHTSRIILYLLMDRMNNSDTCRVSSRELSVQANMSLSAVDKSLNQLVQLNLIERSTSNRRLPAIYHVSMPPGWDEQWKDNLHRKDLQDAPYMQNVEAVDPYE